jgi:hypothetical protein
MRLGQVDETAFVVFAVAGIFVAFGTALKHSAVVVALGIGAET